MCPRQRAGAAPGSSLSPAAIWLQLGAAGVPQGERSEPFRVLAADGV